MKLKTCIKSIRFSMAFVALLGLLYQPLSVFIHLTAEDHHWFSHSASLDAEDLKPTALISNGHRHHHGHSHSHYNGHSHVHSQSYMQRQQQKTELQQIKLHSLPKWQPEAKYSSRHPDDPNDFNESESSGEKSHIPHSIYDHGKILCLTPEATHNDVKGSSGALGDFVSNHFANQPSLAASDPIRPPPIQTPQTLQHCPLSKRGPPQLNS